MDRDLLYYEILNRLKIRKETVRGVAKKLGVTHQNLKQAVVEKWTGPKARLVVREVCIYVDLEPPADVVEQIEHDQRKLNPLRYCD